MKGHVCKVCGFISINTEAPGNCPVCGAPKIAFLEKDSAINDPQDPSNLTDLEKKHIPAITIIKECGLIPQGCQDVHAKIGEIQHPMQVDHSVQHIDFYIDKEFISRVHLTPEKCNPAAALHLKIGEGKLAAIELCNIHGAWISETDL